MMVASDVSSSWGHNLVSWSDLVRLEVVHLLCQLPEGGRQMLTIAGEGGMEGQPNADIADKGRANPDEG